MQYCTKKHAALEADYSATAALFKALGDPTRMAIVAAIAAADEDVCVCDLTAGLPLNQPTVSHHLRVLRAAGLVVCERRGTWVYYRLAPAARAHALAALNIAIPERIHENAPQLARR